MKLCKTILLVLLATIFIGCDSSNSVSDVKGNTDIADDEKKGEDTELIKVSVAKSSTTKYENVVIPQEQLAAQVASNNEFAVNLYNLLAEDGKNLFFSSYSIMNALAMTAVGAEGETKAQMLTAMQANLDGNKFDEAVNGINNSLSEYSRITDGVTINAVNTIWAQHDMKLKESYLDNLARYYDAGVNLLDFYNEPELSGSIINSWIEEQTNQCIKDLIPRGTLDNTTKLVLTNAIYFLGEWLYSFETYRTEPAPFYLENGATSEVPFMHQGEVGSLVKMVYAKVGDVEVLDLPYKGERLVMTFFLPSKGKFSEFESSFSLEKVNEMIGELDTTMGKIIIPKINITYGVKSIKSELVSLGMKLPFSELADFSGITDAETLFVDDVLHKAFVAIDENGTEAAAATAVIAIKLTSIGNEPKHPVFEANRPFVFAIRDSLTGTILFLGKMCDPSKGD